MALPNIKVSEFLANRADLIEGTTIRNAGLHAKVGNIVANTNDKTHWAIKKFAVEGNVATFNDASQDKGPLIAYMADLNFLEFPAIVFQAAARMRLARPGIDKERRMLVKVGDLSASQQIEKGEQIWAIRNIHLSSEPQHEFRGPVESLVARMVEMETANHTKDTPQAIARAWPKDEDLGKIEFIFEQK